MFTRLINEIIEYPIEYTRERNLWKIENHCWQTCIDIIMIRPVTFPFYPLNSLSIQFFFRFRPLKHFQSLFDWWDLKMIKIKILTVNYVSANCLLNSLFILNFCIIIKRAQHFFYLNNNKWGQFWSSIHTLYHLMSLKHLRRLKMKEVKINNATTMRAFKLKF